MLWDSRNGSFMAKAQFFMNATIVLKQTAKSESDPTSIRQSRSDHQLSTRPRLLPAKGSSEVFISIPNPLPTSFPLPAPSSLQALRHTAVFKWHSTSDHDCRWPNSVKLRRRIPLLAAKSTVRWALDALVARLLVTTVVIR
ncbi:hypothetical protein VTN49DRAFT_4862 [Thermomyces lanuginosus]|uniref:uncharacterized protein n=1 Tax=Thermomyces lanuginosus TaxID=5541 RepID=UPI0037448A9A